MEPCCRPAWPTEVVHAAESGGPFVGPDVYYQTGLKTAYSLSDHWSAQLYVMNGWQIIGENNSGKAIGTQVAYSSDRLSASFNTFVGPELPGNDDDYRLLGDFVVSVKATTTRTGPSPARRRRSRSSRRRWSTGRLRT